MEVSIFDHELPDDSHNFYDVYLYDDRINTLVTHDPSQVSHWLTDIQRIHHRRLNKLIVGLDTEWHPNNKYVQNPVATLQLCVGRRCLVFQILKCCTVYEEFPDDLKEFLANDNYTFVGIGIGNDVEKLEEDYGLGVGGRIVDLRTLAAELYGMKELKKAGLKRLASIVLGREVEKPKWVSRSWWDDWWLTPDQVQYACIDAFVSFEIGRRLNASEIE